MEARWEGAPGSARCAPCTRSRATTRRRRTSSVGPAPSPKVRAALLALVDAGGPPLIAHRAKELMHGLGVDVRVAAPRHRGDGVPPRSRRRGSSCSTTSRCASSRWRCSRPTPNPARSTSTASWRSSRPAGAPSSVLQLAAALEHALDARELTDLYERFELPLVRVLAQHGDERHPHRPRVPRGAARGARRAVRDARAAHLRARGRGVQRQLHAAAAHDPVREARARPGEEDEDRAVDRRRLAAEDGRRPPDRRGPPALPRGREAAQHLRRRVPAAHRRRRPHPRHVQADRHHHRADLAARRRTSRTSRCAPPTAARCGARSSPTTAGGSSPPTTRRSSCGCSRTSPRTRASSTRSTAAPTCTPPLRRRCSASTEADVDDAQRRFAKVVNYGLAYGMEAYGLGQRLGIPTGEAGRDPRRVLRRASPT